MTNRARGDYHEHRTRDALAFHGWVVIRAAGSLGPADLVALRAGNTPLLLSCKLKPRISPLERLDLIQAAQTAGALAILAYRLKPGWVGLSVVQVGPKRIEWDQLKVPAR